MMKISLIVLLIVIVNNVANGQTECIIRIVKECNPPAPTIISLGQGRITSSDSILEFLIKNIGDTELERLMEISKDKEQGVFGVLELISKTENRDISLESIFNYEIIEISTSNSFNLEEQKKIIELIQPGFETKQDLRKAINQSKW